MHTIKPSFRSLKARLMTIKVRQAEALIGKMCCGQEGLSDLLPGRGKFLQRLYDVL